MWTDLTPQSCPHNSNICVFTLVVTTQSLLKACHEVHRSKTGNTHGKCVLAHVKCVLAHGKFDFSLDTMVVSISETL